MPSRQLASRNARIVLALLIVGLVVFFGVTVLIIVARNSPKPSSSTPPSNANSDQNPRPGEGLHDYRERIVAGAGDTAGAQPSTLFVLAYLLTNDHKCVSINPGVLSMDQGHTDLTYYSFAEDGRPMYSGVRPYLKRIDDNGELPEFEVPPLFDKLANTDPNHLLDYGPNRLLVEGAMNEGLKQIQSDIVAKLSSNRLWGTEYQSRWNLIVSGHHYELDDQLILPINGTPEDACLPFHYNGIGLWKRYIYPDANILKVSPFDLTLSTNASRDAVTMFYTRFNEVKIQEPNGVLSQGVGKVDVWIDDQSCSGCDRTVVKLRGDMWEKLSYEQSDKARPQTEVQ